MVSRTSETLNSSPCPARRIINAIGVPGSPRIREMASAERHALHGLVVETHDEVAALQPRARRRCAGHRGDHAHQPLDHVHLQTQAAKGARDVAALAALRTRVEVAGVRVERSERRVDGFPEDVRRLACLRLQRLDRLQRRGNEPRHVHIPGIAAVDPLQHRFEQVSVELRLLARFDGAHVCGCEGRQQFLCHRRRGGERFGGCDEQPSRGGCAENPEQRCHGRELRYSGDE